MPGTVEMHYAAETSTDCGPCGNRASSALFVKGTPRPVNLISAQLWICDDCLMLLINTVPLFEWGAREAAETWAALGEEAG